MGKSRKKFMKTAIPKLIPEDCTSTPTDDNIKHEETIMGGKTYSMTSVKYASESEAFRQYELADAGIPHSVSSKWLKGNGAVLYESFVPWSDHYHKLRDEFNKTQQTKPWLDFIGFENLVKVAFKILKDLHSKKLVFANWNNGLALIGQDIRIFRYGREGSTRAHDVHSFLALIGTVLRGEEIPPQNDEHTPLEPIHISFYLRYGLQKDLAYALVALHDYNGESNVDEFLNVSPFWSSMKRSEFIESLHKFFYKVDHTSHTANKWKEVKQRSKMTDAFVADFNHCFIGDEGFVFNWKKFVLDANDKDFIRPILFEGTEPMGVEVGSEYDTQCHVIAYVKNFIEHPPRVLVRTPYDAEIAVNNKFHFCSDIYVAVRKYVKESDVRKDNDDQRLGGKKLRKFICWDSK